MVTVGWDGSSTEGGGCSPSVNNQDDAARSGRDGRFFFFGFFLLEVDGPTGTFLFSWDDLLLLLLTKMKGFSGEEAMLEVGEIGG